jgi:hypothetical protein
MRLRELGSSGGWSAAAVPCSGYLLETGDQKILVDAGTGVITEPLRHCSLADLDAFMDIPSAMAEVFDIHELTDGSSWQFAPLSRGPRCQHAQVARCAQSNGAGRPVLTHLRPDADPRVAVREPPLISPVPPPPG